MILGGSQEEISSWRSQVEPCHHVSFLLFKLLNHHTKVLLFLSCVTVGIPRVYICKRASFGALPRHFRLCRTHFTCCLLQYTIRRFRIHGIRYRHFVFKTYDIYFSYSRYTTSPFRIQDIRYLRFVFTRYVIFVSYSRFVFTRLLSCQVTKKQQ